MSRYFQESYAERSYRIRKSGSLCDQMYNEAVKISKYIVYVLRTLKMRAGKRLVKRRYVFVLDDQCNSIAPSTDGQHVTRYERLEDIESTGMEGIRDALGDHYDRTLEQRFSEKGRLYIVMVNEQFGSLSWVKSGRDIGTWLMDLRPNDFVIFGAFTNHAFRGQRLWGRVIAEAYLREFVPGAHCYADCHVLNVASRRQLERSGFRITRRVHEPS